MKNKAMLSLVLLTVTTGLRQSGVRGAEILPPRALARIGDHRFYHGPGITCAVLSPDGRRIASAADFTYRRLATKKERDAYDPFIVLWDAATGERLHELRVQDGRIQHLAFSPDGKRLSAAYTISDQKYGIVVFAVEIGKLLWQREDFKSRVVYLHFSADGQQLRVSEWCGSISAWASVSGKQLRLWKPPPVHLWKPLPEMPPTEDKISVCGVSGVLSPDGKVVVWEMHPFDEKKVFRFLVGLRVQDAGTDKLLYEKKFEIDPGPTRLLSFVFSADSKRFAARDDNHNLMVWETADGKELLALNISGMIQFALTPEARRAVIYEYSHSESGISYRLRLWDLQTGKPSRELFPDFVLTALIPKTPQVFSADGKTLLLKTYSTLRLFDISTGKERSITGHRTPVTPRYSADGRTLFTSCEEARRSWEMSPGKQVGRLSYEPTKSWEAQSFAHSIDERLFLDRLEDRIRVRDTATGCVVCELEGSNGGASYVQFSPDATQVLFRHEHGDDNHPAIFQLYETKKGKLLGDFKAEEMKRPMFSANGRLVAWPDRAGFVHLHDAATGKTVRTLRSSRPLHKAKGDNDANLLFSPDEEQLIVSASLYDVFTMGDERETRLPVRVFHVSTGREIIRFYANPEKKSKAGRLSCVACSPDGRLLALAEEESGIIRLLEIASGKVRAEFAGHRHGVHGLAFAPDGQTLASGGEDNVVFLWDVTGARTPTAVKKTPKEWWSDLASEDGKRAGVAIASLIRTPEQSVLFLQQRLRPAKALYEKQLAQLIADLDGDAFETREAASRELAQLGEHAEAALRRAMTNRPSLVVRRRIETLLDKLEPTPLPPETLRTLRAIEILEHIGTPAAWQCLDSLAKGAPDARQTQEAKRALDRLAKRGQQRMFDRRRIEP